MKHEADITALAEGKQCQIQSSQNVVLQDWANRINGTWAQAVRAIIETGRQLIACREMTGHGQWCRLFKGARGAIDVPLRFSRQTAHCLMTIAAHPIIANVTHVQHLPPSWGTLYVLCHMPAELLEDLLTVGRIHPDMQRIEAIALRELYRRCAQVPDQSPKADPPPYRLCKDLDNKRQAEHLLRQYAGEVAAELDTPLRLSDDGRIQSGVVWVPPFVGMQQLATTKSKPLHRCPECGSLHRDLRERLG
jgi:hypothetical protein